MAIELRDPIGVLRLDLWGIAAKDPLDRSREVIGGCQRRTVGSTLGSHGAAGSKVVTSVHPRRRSRGPRGAKTGRPSL